MTKIIYSQTGNNIRGLLKTSMAFIMLVLYTSSVQAQQNKDEVVANLINAYGGDKLTSLNSISIQDRYKLFYTGQGVSPNRTEITKNNIELIIDFEHGRKSLTSWESKERGDRLTKTVFDGTKGRIYDLFHHTYDESAHFNFANTGASIIRSHDTLLAHLVWRAQSSVKYIGESNYLTVPHELLTVQMEAGPMLTLHINKETSLISKMTRSNPYYGEITYLFSNYKVTDGITHASDLQINIAGKPDLISVARKIEVNPNVESEFITPSNLNHRGETIDASKMTVHTLADNIYFVGQGHRFSLFIDVGEHFIAVGGHRGLKARYDAVIQKAGIEKPLKYQVVTHHHSDHLSGMTDASELGADFITVDAHVSSIQQALKKPISDDRFTLVNNGATFADGKVKVFNMPSTHSDQNLFVYLPKAKLIFVADHFSTDLKTGLPHADKGTVILRKQVDELQLDVERFVSSHGSRILTISDLHTVAASYSDGICPTDIWVCAE